MKTELTPEQQVIIENLRTKAIYQIADIVRKDWRNVYFGAKPYLSAMQSLTTVQEDYGLDSGKSIVAYFLANANTWRGPIAKAVKAELNRRIR